MGAPRPTRIPKLKMVRAWFAFSLFALGCVRLMDEGTHVCGIDSDCMPGQKCLAASCVDEDVCLTNDDCSSGRLCLRERCVVPQCTGANQAVCGRFRCNVAELVCDDSCSPGGCQEPYRCVASSGACEDRLPNGAPCSYLTDCVSGQCCNRLCADSCF